MFFVIGNRDFLFVSIPIGSKFSTSVISNKNNKEMLIHVISMKKKHFLKIYLNIF